MNNSVDLTVDVCGVRFKTPLVLASGFMGVSQSSLSFIAKHQAGGVTTKSIGHIEREGYSNPTVLPWSCGLINAVGLSNPGVDQSLPHLKEMIVDLKTPLIISFFADTIDNFVKVAEKINSLQPQFMELNASCPNTKSDFGVPFALDASELRKLVAKVRKKITGRTADPWFIKDAFLAAALYLTDYGAAKKDYNSEFNAALSYFAGPSWSKSSYKSVYKRDYGYPVMKIAEGYEADIAELEGTQ